MTLHATSSERIREEWKSIHYEFQNQSPPQPHKQWHPLLSPCLFRASIFPGSYFSDADATANRRKESQRYWDEKGLKFYYSGRSQEYETVTGCHWSSAHVAIAFDDEVGLREMQIHTATAESISNHVCDLFSWNLVHWACALCRPKMLDLLLSCFSHREQTDSSNILLAKRDSLGRTPLDLLFTVGSFSTNSPAVHYHHHYHHHHQHHHNLPNPAFIEQTVDFLMNSILFCKDCDCVSQKHGYPCCAGSRMAWKQRRKALRQFSCQKKKKDARARAQCMEIIFRQLSSSLSLQQIFCLYTQSDLIHSVFERGNHQVTKAILQTNACRFLCLHLVNSKSGLSPLFHAILHQQNDFVLWLLSELESIDTPISESDLFRPYVSKKKRRAVCLFEVVCWHASEKIVLSIFQSGVLFKFEAMDHHHCVTFSRGLYELLRRGSENPKFKEMTTTLTTLLFRNKCIFETCHKQSPKTLCRIVFCMAEKRLLTADKFTSFESMFQKTILLYKNRFRQSLLHILASALKPDEHVGGDDRSSSIGSNTKKQAALLGAIFRTLKFHHIPFFQLCDADERHDTPLCIFLKSNFCELSDRLEASKQDVASLSLAFDSCLFAMDKSIKILTFSKELLVKTAKSGNRKKKPRTLLETWLFTAWQTCGKNMSRFVDELKTKLTDMSMIWCIQPRLFPVLQNAINNFLA